MGDGLKPLYDSIGDRYGEFRRPDARIARALHSALGQASRICNVGAGAGSYEPPDRSVIAVEPSLTMIAQRGPDCAPAVCAPAERLPFLAGSFDAALAILTVHHWPSVEQGLAEMMRIADGKVVLLTWDPSAPGFWLTDYFPRILEIDREIFPSLDQLRAWLGPIEVAELPIPHDCSDGFLGAYWRRPECYLDAAVRGAISTFSKLDEVESGLTALRNDLESGVWEFRYGSLRALGELDLGYRVVQTY